MATPPGATRTRGGRLLGLAANVSLSVAVTVIVAAGAEGLARWYEKPTPAAPLADTRGLDWEAEWDGDFYVVKSESVGWPPSQDFNRDGLRDRPHTVEKPPGTYRVACLGDSVTFGYGFPRRQAWPQALQDAVDARGPGVEVMSAALPGWSTRQERYVYTRVVRRYHPDLVLLGLVLNDIEDLENNLSRPPAFLAALFARSALVRRVVNPQGREIRSVEELFRQPETSRVRDGYRRLFAEIRALAAEVRQDGARLVVLVFPEADQVGSSPPPPVPQQRIATFLAAEEIPGIDALPALRPLGAAGFMDRLHFTPAGSARVAEAVLESDVAVPRAAYATDGLQGALAARAEAADPERAPLPALSAVATGGRGDVRREAMWAIGIRGPAGRPALAALRIGLDDPDATVRAEAARAVARLTRDGGGPLDAAAADRLRVLLQDPRPDVRWAAADALSAGDAPTAIDVAAAAQALRSPDAYIRGYGVWTLSLAGAAAADEATVLEDRLEDPEPGIRTLAVRALGNLGRADAPVIAALGRVLVRGSGESRWRAARALGKLGAPAAAAAPALASALADGDLKVRWECALALDRIGPAASAAVPALVKAEHDSAPEVREAAQTALATITASR